MHLYTQQYYEEKGNEYHQSPLQRRDIIVIGEGYMKTS
jgi:hypothetical protein